VAVVRQPVFGAIVVGKEPVVVPLQVPATVPELGVRERSENHRHDGRDVRTGRVGSRTKTRDRLQRHGVQRLLHRWLGSAQHDDVQLCTAAHVPVDRVRRGSSAVRRTR